MANHFICALGTRRLNNGQVELVVAETLKGFINTGELDQKGMGPVLATGPAIQITQQRRLMSTGQKDFRVATNG